MNGLLAKPRGYASHRLLGLLLFVTVFFLPLHFHTPNIAPQIAKECSCLSGTRTESALAPASGACVALFDYQPFRAEVEVYLGSVYTLLAPIRAPPVLAS
jgi:hypothetical protein